MDERKSALTEALAQGFEMETQAAEELADQVLMQFATAEEVNDESIDAELRSVFYTLQGKRIMTFRRFEYQMDSGEKRRGFAWRIRWEELGKKPDVLPRQDSTTNIYAELPLEAWRHRAS